MIGTVRTSDREVVISLECCPDPEDLGQGHHQHPDAEDAQVQREGHPQGAGVLTVRTDYGTQLMPGIRSRLSVTIL